VTRDDDLRRSILNGSPIISNDKKDAERTAFETVRLRLQEAFSVDDRDYRLLSAEDIRRRAIAVMKPLGGG
jgi:hypothetical protein